MTLSTFSLEYPAPRLRRSLGVQSTSTPVAVVLSLCMPNRDSGYVSSPVWSDSPTLSCSIGVMVAITLVRVRSRLATKNLRFPLTSTAVSRYNSAPRRWPVV